MRVRRWLPGMVVVVAGLAGCGGTAGRTPLPAGTAGAAPGTRGAGTSAAATPGATGSSTASTTAPGGTSPAWLSALTMASPRTGWALRWTADPSKQDGALLVPARTTDGGRTWTDVTPPAARSLLTPTRTTEVLLAGGTSRAWLAVSRQRAGQPTRTVVFTTRDAGRTWQASAPFRSLGTPEYLRAGGSGHGWLVTTLGSAAGSQGVAVFATSDGGKRWALLSRTPAPQPAAPSPAGGLQPRCDKTGIAFATAQTGWITTACAAGAPLVEVTHDGGRTWAPQALPGSGGTCTSGSLSLPPSFFGATGYLPVSCYPAASLLVTHDTGATWSAVRLPRGAGAYPVVRFVSASDGFLVPGGPQGALGDVVYRTTDGGRSWRAVHPSRPFGRGVTLEFVSATAGFAWAETGVAAPGAPPLCRTLDAGRTWHCFTPRAVTPSPAGTG